MVHESLAFTPREKGLNKTALAAYKKQGLVQAAIFGKMFQQTQEVFVNVRAIPAHTMHKGSVFPATINKNDCWLTVEEIQRDFKTQEYSHISFRATAKDAKASVDMMLKIEGHAVGEKAGGITFLVRESAMVEGALDRIPEYLVIDVSKLEVNHKITLAEVTLPAGLVWKERDLDQAVVVCRPAKGYTPAAAAPEVAPAPVA